MRSHISIRKFSHARHVVATAAVVVVADAVDWWKRLRMLLLPGFCSAPEISLLGEGLQIGLKLFWHAR